MQFRMRAGADHLDRSLLKDLPESLSGVRTGGDAALIAGKPDFANRLVAGDDVIPGVKIAVTPDARVKVRINPERGELGSSGGRKNRHMDRVWDV